MRKIAGLAPNLAGSKNGCAARTPQISKIEGFAKIGKSFKPLTTVAKLSILHFGDLVTPYDEQEMKLYSINMYLNEATSNQSFKMLFKSYFDFKKVRKLQVKIIIKKID